MNEPRGASAPLVVETDGPDETKTFAAALADVCRAGDLILLVGDLGAGKTTFAQGFGRALGIAEPITSPTFTLVRRYPLDAGTSCAAATGIRALLHADLYRLDTLGEIADLGLVELIEDGGVALVEWGDVAEGVLGSEWLSLRFEIVDDEHRRIVLAADGSGWVARWPQLADALGPLEGAAGR